MLKNNKNDSILNHFSIRDLKEFYDCYPFHHFSKHDASLNDSKLNASREKICPCCFKQATNDHFCTLNSSDLFQETLTKRSLKQNLEEESLDASTAEESALIVCENYPPSYLSKKDQISTINKDIHRIRKSKAELKKALLELDKLIETDKTDDDSLNEVERFYRSQKFIGSSMNVSSLNKSLPRTDIRPPRYIAELREQHEKNYCLYGTALFSMSDKNMFVDRDLLESHEKLKKAPNLTPATLPYKSDGIIFLKEN